MENALNRAGLFSSRDFLPRFVVLLLLLVAVLVIGYAELSLQRFEENEREMAEKAVQSGANLLDLYFTDSRHYVGLFARDNASLLGALYAQPHSEDLYDQLVGKVQDHFPGSFGIALADSDGRIVVDDFEGRVGEVCRSDVNDFAQSGHPQEIAIHPNPLGYHIDVMVDWQARNGIEGVFLVSLSPDPIANILAQSELPDHRLYLVRRDIPGLIEVSAEGARNALDRPLMLDKDEQSRVLASRMLSGTRWELVDIPDPALFQSVHQRTRLYALGVFLVFFAATFYMARLIRREERGRNQAEEALLDANRQLEARVKQRTQDLRNTNARLQAEIEQRNQAEQKLAASRQRYALAVTGSNDAIWDWDLQEDRIYLSSRYGEMLGEDLGQAPVAAAEWKKGIHPEDQVTLSAALDAVLTSESDHVKLEFRACHADGTYRWLLMRGAVVRDGHGAAVRMAGSLTDITDAKHVEQQLISNALHDALTGLPNRALLLDRLGQAIKLRERHPDFRFAVLFLDLDRFKRVNDRLGHACGDDLLRTVAQRLRAQLDETDTLSRLSGDEFCILLEDVRDEHQAVDSARRLLQALAAEPITLLGRKVTISGSIGIVFSSETQQQAEELLRDADVAMYLAKSEGPGRYRIFDQAVRDHVVGRIVLESELEVALERKQLQVFYQPLVDLQTGAICGVEALLRWVHPDRGLIMPRDFIPLAEESGMILPIGEWVLETACQQLQRWHRDRRTVPAMSVGVNLSSRQLIQPDLVTRMQGILASSGLDGSALRLTLEITETVLMKNLDFAADAARKLKDLGVGLSIDDFGTGYSSLSYLQELPLDTLKLDQSFIARIDSDEASLEIVRAIISLARSLGLRVVAEGIELQSQLDTLREMGCNIGQGFLFSKALPAAEIEDLLDSGRRW